MPSSASGGNDQSFISCPQCHSLQPSILEACNSGFFSSRWPQEQESWGEVGSPLLHAATVRAPFALLAVWGTELGLSQACLQPAGLRELGLAEDTGGSRE